MLSDGKQKMLAIGCALMTNPSLLILGEGTEGFSAFIRQGIWAVIRKLRESGQSILVEFLPVVERCFVLKKGSSADLFTIYLSLAGHVTADFKAKRSSFHAPVRMISSRTSTACQTSL